MTLLIFEDLSCMNNFWYRSTALQSYLKKILGKKNLIQKSDVTSNSNNILSYSYILYISIICYNILYSM